MKAVARSPLYPLERTPLVFTPVRLTCQGPPKRGELACRIEREVPLGALGSEGLPGLPLGRDYQRETGEPMGASSKATQKWPVDSVIPFQWTSGLLAEMGQ